jgi:hypothetical protein
MRGARRGRASVRAVLLALVFALVLLGVGAWIAYRSIVLAERAPMAEIPPVVVLEEVRPTVMPEVVPDTRDPLAVAWVERGPEAVVQATASLDARTVAKSEDSMRTAVLRGEALLALGQLAEALAWSDSLCEALAKPTAAQSCEPLVLEQHARIRMAAGETNVLKQETRLRAAVEARELLSGEVPAEAWATLATLEKARGECGPAVEHYTRALRGVDVQAWLRMKQEAPWRLQLLGLVALDRADCLATLDRDEEARKAVIAVAADLATVLGETDPLAQQAADLRDQLIGVR